MWVDEEEFYHIVDITGMLRNAHVHKVADFVIKEVAVFLFDFAILSS